MIINSPLQPPLCQRLRYSHSTNVINNTAQTQKFLQNYRKKLRVRTVISSSKSSAKQKDYNQYYIDPELRYIRKSCDPKKEKRNLQKQDFIYNNLYNRNFNDWKHPFEKRVQQKIEEKLLKEEEMKKLIRFKKYMEDNKKGRIPIAVEQFLQRKLQF